MSMWFLLFCMSMVVNVISIFYVRWLFLQIKQINDEVQTVSTNTQIFAAHLKQLHEMEMFYGDETLQSLLYHSNELVSLIEDIDFIIYDDMEKVEEEESNLSNEA